MLDEVLEFNLVDKYPQLPRVGDYIVLRGRLRGRAGRYSIRYPIYAPGFLGGSRGWARKKGDTVVERFNQPNGQRGRLEAPGD